MYGTRLREALRELFGVIHRRELLTAERFQTRLEAATGQGATMRHTQRAGNEPLSQPYLCRKNGWYAEFGHFIVILLRPSAHGAPPPLMVSEQGEPSIPGGTPVAVIRRVAWVRHLFHSRSRVAWSFSESIEELPSGPTLAKG